MAITTELDALTVEGETVSEETLVPSPDAPLIQKRPKAATDPRNAADKKLKELENGIFEKSMTMVNDAMCFADLDPENPTVVPREWVVELKGDQRAVERRQRVARAAWMSPKEAPVALMIAKTVMVGVAKARAQENSGDKTLNVSVIQMPLPATSYPTLDVEEDK